MKKVLALASTLCAPMVFSVVLPSVVGIILALLQLGSNIGFGQLVSLFGSLVFFTDGELNPQDFVFLI
jgi:hypothetical protein